jgi:hypothetical protein
MHLDDIQAFPINTQLPDDRYQRADGYGVATNTLSCGPEIPGASLLANSYHTWYGYSSPGYVEYDFEEDGRPRYHKERGISFDVDLDTATPMTAYWYLETVTANANLNPSPNVLPTVLPQVVTRVIMREGDDVSVDDEALNKGKILAQGQTDPVVMSPAVESPQVRYIEREGRHIYEFAVPMKIENARITRDEAYNVRVDVFMDNPVCSNPQYPSDQYLMPNNVRAFTGPDLRPRMDLAVMNPLRIEYVHPQFLGDELYIHTSMNSPWGNYDVAETEGPYATPGGIELRIDGPSPATGLVQAAFVQRHHDHFHHQEPVDVTWLWPFKADRAQNGLYTVTLTVKNDQETATATGIAQFEIGKGLVVGCGDAQLGAKEACKEQVQKDGKSPSKDSPGVGFVVILAMLGAALVLRRRLQ